MAVELVKKIYRPSMSVGEVYARPYGATTLPVPIGNVLELGLERTSACTPPPRRDMSSCCCTSRCAA